MNYDEARQVVTGPDSLGGWRWTTMNDGVIRTAAPCRRYTGPVRTVAEMMREPVKGTDFTTCEPHASKEEAERHFYDYSLEQVEERDCSWTSCSAHCGNPANKTLGNLGMALYFQPTPLCDQHRSREELIALYPFKTGIALIHS